MNDPYLAMSIFENSDPPVALTPKLLMSADARLREHGIEGAQRFVFARYD